MVSYTSTRYISIADDAKIKDIGEDPTGENYAFLNSLYYIGYAPFSRSHGFIANEQV
jgi:hypothetical protein